MWFCCSCEDRVQSILSQNEGNTLTQLVTLFEGMTSLTAKENLLITLRLDNWHDVYLEPYVTGFHTGGESHHFWKIPPLN